MSSYRMTELVEWNKRVEQLVNEAGLNCYEQYFELCSYEDMLCYEAYIGMPAHYPHWSYGKAYERQKTFYQYNLVGLPYEMVINSDPCIAYLMRDNSLMLQVLTMAHVYGHNDFFKNNRLFKANTRAELTVELFKAHANRVRDYIQDPSIGPAAVEKILNAAHSLRFQTNRLGIKRPLVENADDKQKVEAIPDNLRNDLLTFIAEKAALKEWQRDLINIVKAETDYFLPQMETKIMNEGWASYWHYQLINKLDLPQGMQIEFLKRHNMVVRPHEGSINPYYLGFKMFEYLAQEGGNQAIFDICAEERDQSFLRRYLSKQLCEELNLFSYTVQGSNIIVKDVSDDSGWEVVKNDLINNVGLAALPLVVPLTVDKGTLVLEHVFDGRELEQQYAKETLKYIVDLWEGKVDLRTIAGGKTKVLSCSENKCITTRDG